MTSTEANTRRRVKLYILNDERQWADKGTGHISALYNDANNVCLVVISENDGSPLLESKILPETAYQKQQDTLIVWSEGENSDLALSFQEKSGCDDIWEKICSVQGKDPSVNVTQEVVDETDDTDDVDTYALVSNHDVQTFELPACELVKLEEIAEVFGSHLNILQKRELLAAAVDRTNYIRQLVDLFHKAEDLDDLTSLHCLYEIFRQLILFNKPFLYETLFSDENIMDVIGILEYNPAGRSRHRDFLKNQTHFKEVLPLHNSKLINKIHQTYRVQYIQDCCLPPPSLFDEQSMSELKAFITSNKMEILGALQEDRDSMLKLFSCLKSPATSENHRRELALFVKEFCNLSIQTDQKDAFLNTLTAHGALTTVEALLSNVDRDVRSAALVILQAFVENQPAEVRQQICREGQSQHRDDKILVNMMIMQLVQDPDPELGDAYQLSYMLRILIDPDNMSSTIMRNEKSEFLSFFYKRCMNTLTKPLFDKTAYDTLICDDYHSALVLSNVLELLIFCIESHTYHIKNYCLHREIIKRVITLLRTSHRFLALTALRFIRKMIQLKEEFYHRYMVKNNLFKPIVDLFLSNGHRYNMIDSAIIELFEYIIMERISTLIPYLVETFGEVLGRITYVSTFKKLKDRQEVVGRPSRGDTPNVFRQNISAIPSLRATVNSRYLHAPSAFDDDEEERWFSQDDDDKDDSKPLPSSAQLESIPSLVFASTAASTASSTSPPTSPTSNRTGSATTGTSSPFTLLLPSTSNAESTSPTANGSLLNRRLGLNSAPSIYINIKSTTLGALEEAEKDESFDIHRKDLKRSYENAIEISDDLQGSEEVGVSPVKQTRQEEYIDKKLVGCCNNSGVISASSKDKVQAGSNVSKSPPVSVGLVDYSDEDSDEEEEPSSEEKPKRDGTLSSFKPKETVGETSSTKEGTKDVTEVVAASATSKETEGVDGQNA